MKEKYIELLLNRCIDKNSSKILFIHYKKEIKDFVKEFVKEAKKFGIKEFYLDEEDPDQIHEILKTKSLKEIEQSKYFDKSIWDEYAKKNAAFLMFETEYPKLMEDIEDKKIAYAAKISRETKPYYRSMVEKCELSWCIAAYPGEAWAKEIFPNTSNSYQQLERAIYKICMLDQENPIECWDKHLQKIETIIESLNRLHLTKLQYSNSLGTNLEVALPKDYLFSSAKDRDIIVNMPSYEVFLSPIYDQTEGIVYSSKVLNYNGKIVDKFWLRFQKGKVVEYDAKVGKEILKSIIESDEHSSYLGECALVEHNSPISNLNLVFGTTLIDENASCHLALGAGFPESIKDGINLSEKELLERGINVSKNHVDFMIGTPDLEIIGIKEDGSKISIFQNGNFNPKLWEKE